MIEDKPFIGQDAAWKEWLRALGSDRLHHAWILAGARGLGKRAFSRAAVRELLREPGARRPDADVHPDIHVLEHLPANEDEAKKKGEGKPFQARRNITIDQVRDMQRRLTTRPTLGARRAIIIDPADDLEKNAVNALLKSLEEPPAGTYFLLISHQPGRLLPTIRSRCRVLRFAPLEPREIDAVVQRDLPDADITTRQKAIAACHGSPGLALSFVEHALSTVHDLMLAILRDGDTDFHLRGALADEIGARPTRERQLAALELARSALAAELGAAEGERQLRIIEAHAGLVRLSHQAPTFNFDPGLLIMEIGGLLASAAMPREAAR